MNHGYTSDYPAGTMVAGTSTTASVVDVKKWTGQRWVIVSVNLRAPGPTFTAKDEFLASMGYARTEAWSRTGTFHFDAVIEPVQ